MLQKIELLLKEVASYKAKNLEELEQFRVQYLGKKGLMNDLFGAFKKVPNKEKKEFGQKLNQLKQAVQQKIEDTKSGLEHTEKKPSGYDLSKPIGLDNLGSRHPLSLVRNEIVEIFNRIGFTLAQAQKIIANISRQVNAKTVFIKVLMIFVPCVYFFWSSTRMLLSDLNQK